MNCSNCRFYHAVKPNHGECRFAPPTVRGVAQEKWPAVNAVDWCGQIKPAPKPKDKRDAPQRPTA